jgi:hypothetical protein
MSSPADAAASRAEGRPDRIAREFLRFCAAQCNKQVKGFSPAAEQAILQTPGLKPAGTGTWWNAL